MLFNTSTFLVFFCVFYLLYSLLRKRLFAQNCLILLSSYIFYGWWDVRFLFLIAVSTVVDYIAGIGIEGKKLSVRERYVCSSFLIVLAAVIGLADWSSNSWIFRIGLLATAIGVTVLFVIQRIQDLNVRKKAYLFVSVAVNLGMLGFFKYFNFFVDSLQQSAEMFGLTIDSPTLNIVLPVGISFYTFQTLSYSLDIYFGRMKATRMFVEHAAFVAFFPQLVAGPIERAKRFLPQFSKERTFGFEEFKSGMVLFTWGLYKKIVIADNLAPFSDRVFSDPSAFNSSELLLGVFAFTFQIYCDFSGYSDMARGLARILGFELIVNFKIPYISRTPSEFWRRWHISLSSWLRDYLYIGLGGNRNGNLALYRNLALTMLLGGLWHGAAWTFVAWGAFHGCILILYRILKIDGFLSSLDGTAFPRFFFGFSAWLVMFLLTMIGWILFRAVTIGDVKVIIFGIASGLGWVADGWTTVLGLVLPLLVVQIVQVLLDDMEFVRRTPKFVAYNLYAAVLLCIIVFASSGGQEFIYFDF